VVLNVAIVPIIMFVVFKVKVAKHFFVGVMMMIIGFFILVFNVDIFHLASSLNSLKDQAHLVLGDYLTLLSSFIFALHIVLIGYFVRKEDPINLVIIQLSVALILSALTCIINGEPIIHIEPTEFKAALPAIAYLSFSAAFGFSGQIAFQKYLPASNSALIFSTESLFASLTSVFLGFEPFSSGLLIGGIIITLGIVMAETGFKFKERTT
ncbi:MAG: EamA family transporter, partial [Erysipelotrichales bacterium]